IDFPMAMPRPSVQTYAGASFVFNLDKHLVEGLKELAQAEGATLYMVLLAAFHVLLHRYTGQDDILIGSPVSGRTRPEFKETVGCFFNAVVLRANLSGDPSFKSFLGQARSTVLRALEHQDYPSHLLVEKLQSNRNLSRPPLFQVTFILQRPHRFQETFSLIVSDEQA